MLEERSKIKEENDEVDLALSPLIHGWTGEAHGS